MKNENNKRNQKCWKITAIAATIVVVLLLMCCVKGCSNNREEKQMLNGWKFDWSIGLDQRSNSEENGKEDKKKEEAENKQDKQSNQNNQETDTGKEGSKGGAATNNQTNKEASGNLQQPADQLQGEEPEVPKDGDKEIKSPITPLDIIVELPKNRVYNKKGKPVKAYFVDGVTGTLEIKYYTESYGKGLMKTPPVNAGKYYVIVKGKGTGKFCGQATVALILKIDPKPITEADVIVIPPENLEFDTNTKEAEIEFKDGVTGEIVDVIYTGENLNEEGKPVDKGNSKVKVTVKGTGNYTGKVSVTKEYTIEPKPITEADVIVTPPKNLEFDTNTKEAEIEFKDGVTGEIVDVIYTGENLNEEGKPVDKGNSKVKVTVKGTGNYTGEVSVTKEYTIVPKPITEADIIVTPPKNSEFDTNTKEAEIEFKDGVTGEIVDVIYTGENLNEEGKPVYAGFCNVTVRVKGTGNYAGEVSVTKGFSIKKAKHDESNILFASKTFVYNETRTYSLKVEGSPVPVWYEGNEQTEVGEYEVTVHFVVDSNHEPIAPRKAILTIKASSEGEPGEGETDPPTGEDTTKPGNPGEGEQVPPVEEDKKDPEEGEQPPASGEEEKKPEEGEQPPASGEEEKKPEEGEQPPASGEEEKAPEEGKQPPAVEEEEIQEDEQTPSQPSGDVIIEEGIQKNPIEEAPIIESIKAVIAAVVVNNRIYKI